MRSGIDVGEDAGRSSVGAAQRAVGSSETSTSGLRSDCQSASFSIVFQSRWIFLGTPSSIVIALIFPHSAGFPKNQFFSYRDPSRIFLASFDAATQVQVSTLRMVNLLASELYPADPFLAAGI